MLSWFPRNPTKERENQVRLFVSSHRVLTLRDGRRRGDNISTTGWYMPRRSEWLCRRKTCLIKYRAICHGSLWCDWERIILWISSSTTCSPSVFFLFLSRPLRTFHPLRPESGLFLTRCYHPTPNRSSHVFFVSLVSTILRITRRFTTSPFRLRNILEI